jgi:hypothetical protein
MGKAIFTPGRRWKGRSITDGIQYNILKRMECGRVFTTDGTQDNFTVIEGDLQRMEYGRFFMKGRHHHQPS